MLSPNDFIPEDKIDPNPLAEGSRVRVHRLRGHEGLDGRILRVPIEPQRDPFETVQMELLKKGPLLDFLPAPETVRAQIGGQVRHLVSSVEVKSSLCGEEPSAGVFAYELQAREGVDARLTYLRQLRGFVDACKRAYWEKRMLPDLVGKGNVVSDKKGVWLLDFNNISGTWTVGGEVQVPLDDQGLPIFDMGLSFLHRVEKVLLTHRGGNFSTESFNRDYHQDRAVRGEVLPEELVGTLVSAEALKQDPFYGALRFGARRQKVVDLLDRIQRERMVH